MNVSYPCFSASSAFQSISTISRCTGSPAAVVNSTSSGVSITISSSWMYWTRLVWARKAGMAEAMNCSPSPRPMISGHSLRAPTSTPG